MDGNFVERLLIFMDKEGINDNMMTVNAGLSVGAIGKMRKGVTKSVNSNNIEKILYAYPKLSPSWLLTGEGSMLKSDNSPVVSYNPKVGKPYFDVDFCGGFSEIFNDQTVVPSNNIVVSGFDDATLWCNISGHSMEPKINHGDIIALKECRLESVQYGEIYAVVMDDFRTVKILRKSSDPNMFRFIPINPDYDEQEFPKNRIIRVFEVLGSISKFF